MPLNNLIILNKVGFTMSHDTLRAYDVPHTHAHTHPHTNTRIYIKHISKKMYVKQTSCAHVEPHTFSRTHFQTKYIQ